MRRKLRAEKYVMRGSRLVVLLSIVAITQLATYGQQPVKLERIMTTQNTPETATRTPKEMLATAKSIHILSYSNYAPSQAIIAALQKSENFQALDIVITEAPKNADLIFEIDRAPFTTRYAFTVKDRQTSIIVASGHVTSLFGTVPGKVTSSLVKQIKAARSNQPKP